MKSSIYTKTPVYWMADKFFRNIPHGALCGIDLETAPDFVDFGNILRRDFLGIRSPAREENYQSIGGKPL